MLAAYCFACAAFIVGVVIGDMGAAKNLKGGENIGQKNA